MVISTVKNELDTDAPFSAKNKICQVQRSFCLSLNRYDVWKMHSEVNRTVKQGNLKHPCRGSLMESIVFLHLRALEDYWNVHLCSSVLIFLHHHTLYSRSCKIPNKFQSLMTILWERRVYWPLSDSSLQGVV